MISYLRRRIDEFDIKMKDLASATNSNQLARSEARYRSASGDTWDGRGEMPRWLKQAISAGQSIQHFELQANVTSAPSAEERIDWRNDPFAGGPLARAHLQK